MSLFCYCSEMPEPSHPVRDEVYLAHNFGDWKAVPGEGPLCLRSTMAGTRVCFSLGGVSPSPYEVPRAQSKASLLVA